MNIKVGVSNRHIHLSLEHYKFLFGDEEFLKLKDLSQEGEFASSYVVTLKTNKDEIKNVRVIGPLRDYTQVEISRTDSYTLGINPPVRMSGDLKNSEDVTICYKDKCLFLRSACIIANRHIHVNINQANSLGLYHGKKVSVKFEGSRGGILNNVIVKVKDNYNTELHIDTDEANSFGINNGDTVVLLEENCNG